MSSTNRGAARRPDDFYATPAWCTEAILDRLDLPTPRLVLEPAAGDGAIVRVVRERWPDAGVVAFEIDPERATASGALCADYLECLPGCYDVAITNPPYSLAEAFVRKTVYRADVTAMLLRLPFLASQKRVSLWREYPADVHVLPKRPSFTGKGTDSCDYAWFVWGKGRGGRWEVLSV